MQVKISARKMTQGVKHIADDFFALRRTTRGARSDARLERAGLSRASADLDALADALKGADLYAFSRSAMNAAGDLRIDTPRRLEGVIAAVMREPRRVWLEADPRDLDLVLGSLRGVSAVTPRDVSPRHGWGVLAAIEGRGRGQMTIMLRERTEAALAPRRRLRSLPGAHAEALSGAADIRLLCRVDIDANRSSGVSREEFDRAFLKIGAAGDPLLAASEAAIASASGVRERNRILDGAWSLSRLRSVARHQGDPRDQVAGLAAVIVAFAMLAVLAADAKDITATPRRPHADGGRHRGPSTRKEAPTDPSLRIVALNLADQALDEIYGGGGGRGVGVAGDAADARDAHRTGRVRHPVRGHLFLARNGVMTYRRPHWRGEVEQLKPAIPVIHYWVRAACFLLFWFWPRRQAKRVAPSFACFQ